LIKNEFPGRWTLHVVQTQADCTSNREPRQDHYKDRQGFIIYDGLGGMDVHHVMENYENYEFEGSGGLDSFTRNDLKHIADNFVYFGTYKLIDTLNIIEHHIESAINPRRWGSVFKRSYPFNKDTLMLSPITNRYPKTRLKWVRLNDKEVTNNDHRKRFAWLIWGIPIVLHRSNLKSFRDSVGLSVKDFYRGKRSCASCEKTRVKITT